jgi:ADP-ribose pyrophosphatase YjhB (NUDIX family)
MSIKQVYRSYSRKDLPPADGFLFCPRCKTELEVIEIDHKPRPACPACGFIRFRNPAPAVSLLMVKGDRVLLGKRGGEPGKGKWATPSGYIEYDDDFLTTALREAKEETGLDVELKAILNVSSTFLSPGQHFFSVYLLATVTGGELAAGDDLEAVDWFPITGPLPELAFQEDADILAAYAKNTFAGLPIDPNFAQVKASKVEPDLNTL